LSTPSDGGGWFVVIKVVRRPIKRTSCNINDLAGYDVEDDGDEDKEGVSPV